LEKENQPLCADETQKTTAYTRSLINKIIILHTGMFLR